MAAPRWSKYRARAALEILTAYQGDGSSPSPDSEDVAGAITVLQHMMTKYDVTDVVPDAEAPDAEG